jgi:hypothetical protein
LFGDLLSGAVETLGTEMSALWRTLIQGEGNERAAETLDIHRWIEYVGSYSRDHGEFAVRSVVLEIDTCTWTAGSETTVRCRPMICICMNSGVDVVQGQF